MIKNNRPLKKQVIMNFLKYLEFNQEYKAQAAMEYLTTYGWSILLVAIALISLFELGIFNSNNFATSGSCIANGGYLCSDPVFATNGILTVLSGESFGQMTVIGTTCLTGTASPPPSSFNAIIPTTFNIGQTFSLEFYCSLPSNAIGENFSGSLWLQYNENGVKKQKVQMARITLSATVSGIVSEGNFPQNEYYIPVTIQNTQNIATPGNFQQMINITENNYVNYLSFNGNVANFEYVYQNGTIIPGWIESNNSGKLITWVKIVPQIQAQSSLTIYLALVANTINLLSRRGNTGIGEAPQLGSSWAEYDNGASVFPVYSNWQGPTSPSGWSYSNRYGSYTPIFNPGTNSGGGNLQMMDFGSFDSTAAIYQSPFTTSNVILESSYSYNAGTCGADDVGFGMYANAIGYGRAGADSPSALYGYYNSYEFYCGNKPAISYITAPGSTPPSTYAVAAGQDLQSSGFNYMFVQMPITTTGIMMNFVTNTGNIYQSPVYSGLTTSVLYSGPVSNTNSILYLGASTGGAYSYSYIYWFRIRAYPPNGIMPTATLGNVS